MALTTTTEECPVTRQWHVVIVAGGMLILFKLRLLVADMVRSRMASAMRKVLALRNKLLDFSRGIRTVILWPGPALAGIGRLRSNLVGSSSIHSSRFLALSI